MLRIYFILHWILIVSAVFNDTSCVSDDEDFAIQKNIYVNGKPTTESCSIRLSKLYTYGYHVGEQISISLHSSIPYTLKCDDAYQSLQKIEFKYKRPDIIANPPLLMTEESHNIVINCTLVNETEADLFTFHLLLVNADAFYPKIDTSNVAVLQEYMSSIYIMYIFIECSPNEEDIVSIRVSGKIKVDCRLHTFNGFLRLDFSRDNIKNLYITEVSGPNLNNRIISCLSGDNTLIMHLIKPNQSYDGNDNGRTSKDGVEPLSYTTVSELEPETTPTSPFLGYILTVVVVSLVVGGAATYFYYRRRNQKINANMANNDVNQSAPASADPDYPTFCGNPAYDGNLYSAINVDPEDCYHFYHEIPSRPQ